MSERGGCRTCHAAIIWAVTAAGNRMIPLDAVRDGRGNLTPVLTDAGKLARSGTGLMIVRVLSLTEMQSWQGLRFTSHFQTCPHAAAHRRRKART
jgi:hypothetical protein